MNSRFHLSDTEVLAILRADLFLNLTLALLLMVHEDRIRNALPARAAAKAGSSGPKPSVLLGYAGREQIRLPGGELLLISRLSSRITNDAPVVLLLPESVAAVDVHAVLGALHEALPANPTAIDLEPLARP